MIDIRRTNRLARTLFTASEDYDYVYDPRHTSRPHDGKKWFKTPMGWSTFVRDEKKKDGAGLATTITTTYYDSDSQIPVREAKSIVDFARRRGKTKLRVILTSEDRFHSFVTDGEETLLNGFIVFDRDSTNMVGSKGAFREVFNRHAFMSLLGETE